MVDVEDLGHRPCLDSTTGNGEHLLSICPGAGIDVTGVTPDVASREHASDIGNTLEIWEGYATDPGIRHNASSGGVLTALALFCLEQEGMDFVLHTASDPKQPWENISVKSRTRDELVRCAGSRYAPSSPCAALDQIETAAGKAVFIGKPCDVAAVRSLRKHRPNLDEHLGIVLTFFCAGTPSTRGTLDLLESLGAPSDSRLENLRYRGQGWPGEFQAQWGDGTKKVSLSYQESWGKLNRHLPLRCKLCPDGLGSTADIACGDSWGHWESVSANPGLSLVLVRTPRGKKLLRKAMSAGVVSLRPCPADVVATAQDNLLGRRRELYGRLLAFRVLAIPVPMFLGFDLLRSWIRLPLGRLLRSLAGTLRRAFGNGWRYRRTPQVASH